MLNAVEKLTKLVSQIPRNNAAMSVLLAESEEGRKLMDINIAVADTDIAIVQERLKLISRTDNHYRLILNISFLLSIDTEGGPSGIWFESIQKTLKMNGEVVRMLVDYVLSLFNLLLFPHSFLLTKS